MQQLDYSSLLGYLPYDPFRVLSEIPVARRSNSDGVLLVLGFFLLFHPPLPFQ